MLDDATRYHLLKFLYKTTPEPDSANAATPIFEDEISLRDLWEIVAKRKWLVFLASRHFVWLE